MGRIVISSAHYRDTHELIQHGVNGFIADPLDHENLRCVLREIWHAQPRWKSIGARAREEILARHTWKTRYRKLLETLVDMELLKRSEILPKSS